MRWGSSNLPPNCEHWIPGSKYQPLLIITSTYQHSKRDATKNDNGKYAKLLVCSNYWFREEGSDQAVCLVGAKVWGRLWRYQLFKRCYFVLSSTWLLPILILAIVSIYVFFFFFQKREIGASCVRPKVRTTTVWTLGSPRRPQTGADPVFVFFI